MGSSSSDRINISARIQKLEVDNRFPLRFYFRMADIILRQADVYREEKDTLYLYITLIRFASLVCETIPDHRDYITCDQRERSSWKKVKKKLLNSLDELEVLNPEVKQKINELNRRNGYQNSRHDRQTGESIPRRSDKQKVESVGTCSSSTAGANSSQYSTPEFPFGLRGNRRLKKETRIQVLLEEAHDWKLPTPCRLMPQAHPGINQPTAPPVEEDIDLVRAIDASIQSSSQERPPFPDETNASSSYITSIDSEDLSQHETSRGGDSDSHAEIHIISTIQASATSATTGTPSSPSPTAPPVSDDCLNDPLECQTIDSTRVEESENSSSSSSSSCVICMDAAIEGAFIPCGHMAGCMACMNDIKDKNWDCPVCRAKVDQVLRLYAV